MLNLYFAPLACSLASRISLYEAGADARFSQVDTRSKRLADGGDFFAVNPMGQVPALETDDGQVLTVAGYHARMLQRPSVAKAVGEEFALFQAAQKAR